MQNTVWQNYLAILSSTRFHQLAAMFIVQVAAHYLWIDAWMANALTVLLTGSVAINTIDRFTNLTITTPSKKVI